MTDKPALESKKFLAFLIAEFTWKALLVVALFVFRDQLQAATLWGWWFMIATVIVAGFVEVGFIGGQAWLDKYVRVAQITANPKLNPLSTTDPTDKTDPGVQK